MSCRVGFSVSPGGACSPRCSHAAAVGPVDPEQIFYLQSRGIPPEEGERIVVQGFLDVVAARLPDEDLRAAVERLVDAKLAQR